MTDKIALMIHKNLINQIHLNRNIIIAKNLTDCGFLLNFGPAFAGSGGLIPLSLTLH